MRPFGIYRQDLTEDYYCVVNLVTVKNESQVLDLPCSNSYTKELVHIKTRKMLKCELLQDGGN
jgi:lipopolysaccharide biosynthesis protein